MNALSQIETDRVKALLNARFGLDGKTLSSGNLEQALRQRSAVTKADNIKAYLERLSGDEAELQNFVEELLVPETWFFRDVLPFECLRQYVCEDWRPRTNNKKLRVLSVPCSTGEEPYSIAMTLMDQGLDASRLHIDGVDLSRSGLAKAAEGIYGKTAFRGESHQFERILQRFLEQKYDRFSVKSEIRNMVHFRHANLAAADFLANEAAYDVIFCRNVLIYFHVRAREIALVNLHRLLAPGGLLYVGHVEAAIIAEGSFSSLDSFPFAFRPIDGDNSQRSNRISKKTKVVAPRPADYSYRQTIETRDTTSIKTIKPTEPVASAAGESDEELLRSAREAANSGRLEEAENICTNVLAKFPVNADAFCLLGLISRARDDISSAEKHFQKALYLDPQHHESLVHMMLIAQQCGDRPAEANYRRRAEQAIPAGGDS
ncbi:MAG: methyltransferase domain-containing protein [Pirellulales bacterium]|nr:methyltransferase domain-containing protein [Pirellulales bacterium]